jgi:hypothetical protein
MNHTKKKKNYLMDGENFLFSRFWQLLIGKATCKRYFDQVIGGDTIVVCEWLTIQ